LPAFIAALKRCATQNPDVAARLKAAPFQTKIKVRVKGVGPFGFPLGFARGFGKTGRAGVSDPHEQSRVPRDSHSFIFLDVQVTLLPVLGWGYWNRAGFRAV
jgi:hypothetical protein